jgi:hypothetical protein
MSLLMFMKVFSITAVVAVLTSTYVHCQLLCSVPLLPLSSADFLLKYRDRPLQSWTSSRTRKASLHSMCTSDSHQQTLGP